MSVIPFLLLSSLGLAMTVQAQNCSTPVGGPNMNLKGDSILLQTFPDGTQVSFACNIGYMSSGGSAAVTCTAGSWSPVRLKCNKKNCGSAGDVPNGQIDYPQGNEFGDKAVITCNTGYRLVGRKEITCGDQGWMNRLPVCEVVTCDPPRVVANATFSPNKEYYQYREVVQYSCIKDHTLNGSKSISCSDDGTFEPGPPTCTKVQCKEPVVLNAEWSGGSRPPYRHMSTVTLQCLSEYVMKGPPTLTCNINSEWSPGFPICEKRIAPTTKATTTTTTTTPSSPTTKKPTDAGNELPKTLGIVFGVIFALAVLTICGCYCFGVPAFIKKKRGTRRGNTDKEATKDGEDVALS